MISLQTNVDSMIAQNNLKTNEMFQSNTIQQLTSGYKINRSGDDAAGLAIANGYRDNIAELTQGVSNANDGVSQLQIIDGGLSNISTILDRMKTLATESASQTFTGNRNTLNQEYSTLLSEITRQASNINLNAGGSLNQKLSVYIGGSSTAANAGVTVDLSGATNAVDATSLGLTGTSVAGSSVGITGNSLNLNAPGATFVKGTHASDGQTFTFNITKSDGTNQTVQATIAATANGSTLNQVLTSLNGQLSSYGISAGVNSQGQLQFTGSTAFTVSDNAVVTPPSGQSVTSTSTGSSLLTNEVSGGVNGTAENTSNYVSDGQATYAAVTGSNVEHLSFTTSNGNTINVALTSSSGSGDTLANAISTINKQTAAYGIYAVQNAAGTGISFQSANSFSVNDEAATRLTAPTAATGTSASIAGNTVTGLTGSTKVLDSAASPAAANQTFTFNVGAANPITVTINATSGGTAMSTVLNTFNTALAGTGITAAISGGALVFQGSAAFTVVDAGNTASLGSSALTSTVTGSSKTATNTTLNNYDYTSWSVPTGNSITFNVGNSSTTVALTSLDSTVSHAVQTLNNGLAGTGITAVIDGAGTGISFQSASTFSMDTPSTTGSTAVYNSSSSSGSPSSYTASAPTQSGIQNAQSAISALDAAIQSLGLVQGSVGAGENKLQYALNLAQSQIANFSSAESQIRDADVAAEAANLTKAQVLQQTSIAAMAQANSEPQSVLKLLQ
jgi:flagellin